MESQTLKRTYTYRLYPTKTQQDILERQLSLCRWLYNHFLEKRRILYKENKIKISCCHQIKEIPKLKKEKPELNDVYSQTLQDVVRRLDKAFQHFFRRVEANRNGIKKQRAGYPRFKGYRRYDSFTYPQSGFKLKDNRLYLSKIGSLKIRLHRPIEGNIKTLTIRRTNTNKWYACFSVEIRKELSKKKEIKNKIGIDVGLTNFLTTDKGEKIDNPRYLAKLERKLAKLQRWHSRKKLKSKNREKSRLKIARLHEKISNQRTDFFHKLSRKLINSFQLIAFEKLNLKGMIKNNYLAKSIADASWSRFFQHLKYKAEEAGIWVVEVNSKNTSQICSGCGGFVRKTLTQRKHQCLHCGLTIDRDINSARNILQLALISFRTAGTAGINACGVGRILSTMKQEATGFNQW